MRNVAAKCSRAHRGSLFTPRREFPALLSTTATSRAWLFSTAPQSVLVQFGEPCSITYLIRVCLVPRKPTSAYQYQRYSGLISLADDQTALQEWSVFAVMRFARMRKGNSACASLQNHVPRFRPWLTAAKSRSGVLKRSQSVNNDSSSFLPLCVYL
jgi:hypothetical protein